MTCDGDCILHLGHAYACRCAAHATDWSAAPTRLPLSGDTFADLLRELKKFGLVRFALPLRRAGVSTPRDLCAADKDLLLRLGLPKAFLRHAGFSVELTEHDLAAVALPTPLAPLEPLRQDHSEVRLTKRGRQELGAAVTLTQESRDAALAALDEAVLAPGSHLTVRSQWKTWCYFANCWGVPPLPLTVDTVRKVLASFRPVATGVRRGTSHRRVSTTSSRLAPNRRRACSLP